MKYYHLRNFSVGFGIPNKMYWQQHGAQFEKRNEAKTPDIIIQRKIRSNLKKKITLKEQNVYCIIISIFTIDSQHKSIRTFRSGGTYVRWYTIISLLWLHACYFIILKRFFYSEVRMSIHRGSRRFLDYRNDLQTRRTQDQITTMALF